MVPSIFFSCLVSAAWMPFVAKCASSRTTTEILYGVGGTTTKIETLVSPQQGDNSFLRPSKGERITAGSIYTIQWANPAVSLVNIFLEDDSGYAHGYGNETCPGYLINDFCAPLGLAAPNNGQLEWFVKKFDTGYTYTDAFFLRLGVDFLASDYDFRATMDFTSSDEFLVVQPGSEPSTTVFTTTTTSKTTSQPSTTTKASPALTTTPQSSEVISTVSGVSQSTTTSPATTGSTESFEPGSSSSTLTSSLSTSSSAASPTHSTSTSIGAQIFIQNLRFTLILCGVVSSAIIFI
ncbi:hypothetical protein GQ53DRAFT_820079 [Thozetella sp. PMI_491]|nr:hypothetical protein GQ53DRAFT_820079 [Thozetella sp. PMI_491]